MIVAPIIIVTVAQSKPASGVPVANLWHAIGSEQNLGPSGVLSPLRNCLVRRPLTVAFVTLIHRVRVSEIQWLSDTLLLLDPLPLAKREGPEKSNSMAR